ncbi:hypothetical protein [Argonema antarcticum]|nr:hypothetical protein [Argonema antarcticum]
MLNLSENGDVYHCIIAATASYYQAILIATDEKLPDFSEVKTVWD